MPLKYFSDIENYCIGVADVPQKILRKLIKHHLNPMEAVREDINLPIWASQESGFRPYNWEIARGRSGNSQHCFGQKSNGVIYSNELGAVDWTCKNFSINKRKLLKSILKHTKYTRIAMYNNFIHCDHKVTKSGKKEIYDSTSKSNWTLLRTVE